MVFSKTLLTALLATGASADNMSFRGYETMSSRETVRDHSLIDLDVQSMKDALALLSDEGYAMAKDVYAFGGHSKSVASVEIQDGLPQDITKGHEFTGLSVGGNTIKLKAFADADENSNNLQLQYIVDETYAGCYVSKLPEPDIVVDGCLAATGTISSDDTGGIDYIYDVEEDNESKRTIRGFSLSAGSKMTGMTDYDIFVEYYGQDDYADLIMDAAWNEEATDLTHGNMDFGVYEDWVGLNEVVKKTSVTMNILMYVIYELEDAVNDCFDLCNVDGTDGCNSDNVNAWDEGVAFYYGSLAADGSSNGNLLYALAQKRGANFKTCGPNGDSADCQNQDAYVNIKIGHEFTKGKNKLLKGDCQGARDSVAKIVNWMKVFLIQGTLRYSQKASVGDDTEKSDAEGAAFTAAVIPWLYKCNEDDAAIVHAIMESGSDEEADFAAVKRAFENNYPCLGTTCAEVGGLYEGGKYIDGGDPCDDGTNVGLAVGLAVGLGVPVLILAIWFFRGRSSGGGHDVSGSMKATDHGFTA